MSCRPVDPMAGDAAQRRRRVSIGRQPRGGAARVRAVRTASRGQPRGLRGHACAGGGVAARPEVSPATPMSVPLSTVKSQHCLSRFSSVSGSGSSVLSIAWISAALMQIDICCHPLVGSEEVLAIFVIRNRLFSLQNKNEKDCWDY